jgi:hypothetical protein
MGNSSTDTGMYATRTKEAEFAGLRADFGAPYYHDDCVQTDSEGFALTDEEGNVRIWLKSLSGMCESEQCKACGRMIE